MVYSGQIGQTFYAADMPTGYPGQIIGMGNYRGLPYIHSIGGVQGVYSVTMPGTVNANTVYSLAVDGEVVSVTTGASTTLVQLGTLLFNALRANAVIFRKVDVAVNGTTGTLTLTARVFNTPVVVTSPSGGFGSISTTTAPGTDAAYIPYGRFVGRRNSAAYPVDANSGVSPAALIDDVNGFTVLGITMKSFHEKDKRGPSAVDGYPFLSTMSVLDDCSEIEGIWVDAVETTINVGETPYIAVSAGNQGKLTTNAAGTLAISSNCRIIRPARVVAGRNIVGVYFRRTP